MAKSGESLTRHRVLEAALRIIDQEGLEGFNMRKLGASLGVEAMSIYNHIENKRAVFDGVIELLILQAPLSAPSDTTPCEELWVFAHAFRDVLRSHPRVLPLVATSPLRTQASLAMLDHLLETLHQAKITGVQSIYALQCLVGFIVGHTLLGTGTQAIAGLEPGPNGPMVWQRFPADQYPRLHMLLPDIAQWNADQEFDFGLHALFQSLFR
ncbi:MAG: TetR/AcrR family transcriptional regulator C-terminal domain-containing protein [Anaerolineaceae bacterium]|nr:TetR/AcrR family transcriptional regulator C-terminal domain-containing protein [Anaerolineaceae bacterium]